MSDNKPTTGKPFLRALKLAAKIHKEGGTVQDAYTILAWSHRVDEVQLPSAAQPAAEIVAQLFNNLSAQTLLDQGRVALLAEHLGCEVQA